MIPIGARRELAKRIEILDCDRVEAECLDVGFLITGRRYAARLDFSLAVVRRGERQCVGPRRRFERTGSALRRAATGIAAFAADFLLPVVAETLRAPLVFRCDFDCA